MGSLVVFPFWTETPDVVLNNVKVAAEHGEVDEVLCIGREKESTFRALARETPLLSGAAGKPINLVVQDRIGSTFREGKGDGMNTGLTYFLDSDHQRLHFYDADITTFDDTWITKGERGADLGYDMVRNYFPRSSTDGMITWMITRPLFAMLFPHSELPWIDQPLGGELVVSRSAAEILVADHRVRNQSDWGIDTTITFSAIQHGMSMLEVYIPQGKVHKLYGRLTDIRQMLIECFAVIQALSTQALSGKARHHIEAADVTPEQIVSTTGYDYHGTLDLVVDKFSTRQEEILSLFDPSISDGLRSAHKGQVSFLDEFLWYDALSTLVENYEPFDPDWEELLFQLWIVRVLAYTKDVASRGYEHAMRHLRGVIDSYLHRSVKGSWMTVGTDDQS